MQALTRALSHRLLFLFVNLLSACLPFLSYSQSARAGSIEYLPLKNGFKMIALGADIGSFPVNKLDFLDHKRDPDDDNCYKYEFKDAAATQMDSTLNLDLVGIRTYNQKIVNIYLFFNRKDGYQLLRYFISIYGVFSNKPNDYADIYNWNSTKVSLCLNYELKTDMGIAVFTLNPLQQKSEIAKIVRLFASCW